MGHHISQNHLGMSRPLTRIRSPVAWIRIRSPVAWIEDRAQPRGAHQAFDARRRIEPAERRGRRSVDAAASTAATPDHAGSVITAFVMMGSRVRVTQAAPRFLRKIKKLDPTSRGDKLETSLPAKPLSPRCLQKNASYRIWIASIGGAFLASKAKARVRIAAAAPL